MGFAQGQVNCIFVIHIHGKIGMRMFMYNLYCTAVLMADNVKYNGLYVDNISEMKVHSLLLHCLELKKLSQSILPFPCVIFKF